MLLQQSLCVNLFLAWFPIPVYPSLLDFSSVTNCALSLIRDLEAQISCMQPYLSTQLTTIKKCQSLNLLDTNTNYHKLAK